MKLQRIAVVGASLAGLRAVQALRARGYSNEVVVIGEEPEMPYNRPPLSKQYLRGEIDIDGLYLRRENEALESTWMLGVRAEALDVTARRIRLSTGDELGYDAAIIATGSASRIPALPGIERGGVHFLKTVGDAQALRKDLARSHKVVVIGAGFIGCEVASCCRVMGLDVTVVDPAPAPMVRALGEEVGRMVESMHRAEGTRFIFGHQIVAIEGNGRVDSVLLDDGTTLSADVVVVGVGSVARTEWLHSSGLMLDNGVICDEACRVIGGEGRLAAAGDVANFPHLGYFGRRMRVEHWTQAAEQADAAVESILNPDTTTRFTPIPSLWSDQCGKKIQALGAPWLGQRVEFARDTRDESKVAASYWLDDDLVGAVTIGWPSRLSAFRRELETRMQRRMSEVTYPEVRSELKL